MDISKEEVTKIARRMFMAIYRRKPHASDEILIQEVTSLYIETNGDDEGKLKLLKKSVSEDTEKLLSLRKKKREFITKRKKYVNDKTALAQQQLSELTTQLKKHQLAVNICRKGLAFQVEAAEKEFENKQKVKIENFSSCISNLSAKIEENKDRILKIKRGY